MADLERACTDCNGTGRYLKKYWRTSKGMVYYTKPKSKCSEYEFDSPCDSCNGRGSIITEYGQQILDFVKKYSDFAEKDHEHIIR